MEKIDNLFVKCNSVSDDYKHTVGFHWFNGSNETKEHLKNISKRNIPENTKVLFLMKYKISFITY